MKNSVKHNAGKICWPNLVNLPVQCFNWFYEKVLISLNYIKQLGLKDTLRLKCRFMMETLHSHKYDTPLARVGHLGGPHVFGFLIKAFCLEIWPQMWGTSIQGEMNNWNPWLMLKCYFTENCVSFKYLFFNMSYYFNISL